MKKRTGLVVLAIVVILALAFLVRRQGEGEKVERLPDSQVVHAETSGGVSDLAKPKSNEAVAQNPPNEPTPEMGESMTTATAQITRGDGSKLDIRSIDGEFERLLVYPNEILKIRVALKGFDANRSILVESDNGGSLNRKVGPLTLPPATGDGAIEFEYSIGGNTGRYTLFVSQGNRQELLEFRAGPEPPTGQSGPARIFNPEHLEPRKVGT